MMIVLQYCWRDTVLEQEVEFAMSVVRTVRSMRADYQLNKLKTERNSLFMCFCLYICFACSFYARCFLPGCTSERTVKFILRMKFNF
jgi:hypothetical protein